MSRRCALFLLGLAVAATPAAAAGPFLITDLNSGPGTAGPLPAARPGLDSVELGGFLYFPGEDGMHGRELWRTDGTREGTQLVRDVCPGPCSSQLSSLTAFGNLLAFRATDELHGWELWISDGTRAGTRMLRDQCPGGCSSTVDGLAAFGDRLFFDTHSTRGEYRQQLMVTDGTAAGTRTVLELNQYWPLRAVGEVKGRFAFLGPGAGYFQALWWSDGTPEGTVPVLDLCTSPDCSRSWNRPIVVGDRIVFWDQPSGQEIWSSDGTASGTRKIGDAFPPPPDGAVLWKSSLYFTNFGGLWRTDGTPEGTRLLRSFTTWETRVRSILPLDDVLLFTAGDATKGETLWQTQGTPESTRIVSAPALNDALAELGPLTRAGNQALFPIVWPSRSEIWKTDGTAAGTRRLAQLCGGGGGGGPLCRQNETAPAYPAAVNGRYLFGLAEATYGFELWTVDASGPRLVRDIQRNAGSSRFRGAPAKDVAALGNRLVFSARTDQGAAASLWTSDGTAAGTREIGPDIPWPRGLVQIGDRLWLRGSTVPYSGTDGSGLWSTDGTAAGTIRLAPDIGFGSLPGGRPGLVLVGGNDGQVGHEPWVSDGTPGGTRLLLDIDTQTEPSLFPGAELPGSSDPAHFTSLGSSLLFAADDGLAEVGRELWTTDGTTAGTRLLADINRTVETDGITSWPGSSAPGPFVRFGDRFFFAADDGIYGRELWKTDGTAAGTVLGRDLRPGAAGSSPRDLATAGGRLYFLADGGASDALWSIAASGQVGRVRLLGFGRRASGLVAAGARVFFVVDNAGTGPELWTSDGTRAGTRLVREIRPGKMGSYPQELTVVGNLLLFAADDGVHGLEPWVTDGTAAGTRLLADLAPGADASAPANFSVAGDLVGFDADDGIHGREMWAVRKGDLRP
jgi:ELWxxDGT repeat protein